MSNFYELKNKISTIKNTRQVTKALQIVAASRQKKTRDSLNNSRFLRDALRYTMRKITSNLIKSILPSDLPRFFCENTQCNKVLIVNVMSQRGLCGGLNSKLFYKILKLKEKFENEGKKVNFISVNKISQKFLRNFNENIIAFFGEISQSPDIEEIRPLINMVKTEYLNYNKVFIAYSNFLTTGIYEPEIVELLPVNFEIQEKENKSIMATQYIIEPNPLMVIENLANLYIDLEIYEAILSSIASENTARMISMKKATDNIDALISSFIWELNQERQSKITQQCAEISANL